MLRTGSSGNPNSSIITVERITKIGFIGRLEEAKGVDIFLREGLKLVQSEGKSLYLAGNGDKEYVDFLKKIL
ncbi:hypothetical protein ACLKMH_14440 [Psychromonas sp. KJ10-10]|uniref:hypothetical protein n=1 Tax=Psychromonas sp. KJ10-10 TaxID=3391823 RepID=UPI0039B42C0C